MRNGTSCIFLFTEPLSGWRYADAQEQRTRQDCAKQIEWLLTEQYPDAEKVVLVMDNLNTRNIASLYAAFPPQHARGLAERLEMHCTAVGWILPKLSYLLLDVVNVLQITEYSICLLPELYLCCKRRQGTHYKKALTDSSLQMMQESCSNIFTLLLRFRVYKVLALFLFRSANLLLFALGGFCPQL
ncbi:MAG: hypothetical protein HFJ89_10655 [Oscillospiraceae bacterium]|nr:hypothetical protein [Oscillospiraceae bacterium]